jgi:hypothetical protein
MKKKIIFAISTITFGIISSVIYDEIKAFPILTTLYDLTKKFLTLLNINMPLWFVFVCVFSFLFIRKLLLYIIIKKQPKYYNYKEDKFINWRWKWDYDINGRIVQLRAYCPKCNTRMQNIQYSLSQTFKCPKCNYTSLSNSQSLSSFDSEYEDTSTIAQLIMDKIEKEYLI